ncbi:MAG: hypothetical protein IIZ48_01065 [Erysipelotrichales bacterium]|nr:hypothetical protein [Erysipelotrichales bacterium]
MKKMILLGILAALAVLSACTKTKTPDTPETPEDRPSSEDQAFTEFYAGAYVLEDRETGPCVIFNAEDHTFHSAAGFACSYALRGTYEVKGNKIICTSDGNVLEFDVLPEEKICLTSVSANRNYTWLKEGDIYESHRWVEPSFGITGTADEALAWAKENGAVVTEDARLTAGKDAIEKFYKDAENGIPSTVLIASYYTLDPDHVSPELYEEEKDQYPQLFLKLLEYNGTQYILTVRDCTKEEIDTAEGYTVLRHFTGENPVSAVQRYYDVYVLTDDADVTWERISAGIVSSQSGDWVRHSTVILSHP